MKKLILHSLRIKILIAVFLLLTVSLSLYLLIHTSVNTSLYTVELDKKITTTVELNVAKVNHYTTIMEQKAADLARAGEILYRIAHSATSTNFDADVSTYLIDNFKTFPAAIGGGLWFEPNKFYADKKYFGPYAYWDKGAVVFTWDLNTPKYDYFSQGWYTIALPPEWDRMKKRDEEFYWTAPYIDEAGSFAPMVTVDAFIYSPNDEIVGISTADWSTAEMLAFLEESKISPDSQLFLVDGNSNMIMANTFDAKTIMKDASSVQWMENLVQPERGRIKNTNVSVNSVEYTAYYTLTEIGMFYGILVPTEVINGPIDTLFQLNSSMLLTLALVLLLVFYLILLGITSPILKLTETVRKVTGGDLTVRAQILSNDEIGTLAGAFNDMTSKLKSSYENIEKNVEQKTHALSETLQQLETKHQDLENSQMATANLLEDLEEEKRAVEGKVLDRTEDLEREKQKLLQVTQNMKGGGILLDTKCNIIFTNNTAHDLLHQMGSTDILKIDDFFAYFNNNLIRGYFERCVKGESFHVPEIEGQGKVYEIFFHYLLSEQHNTKDAAGYFILMIDITDAKLLERSKSELVAVASHQLRTPLTAMRGNVEMLVDESYGPLNKEQHELLSDIDISTIRLITMVNDMLDITKIEKDDLEMSLENINVKEILDSILSDLSDYATRHQFKIICHDIDSTATVYADKMRIRQVIQNLTDNAIKYSRHPGQLDITFRDSEGFVELAFKDNGIGVPKVEQTKLFGRFYRASNTAKTSSSGSGLGLYIVRSIVRQLGGDIWFESDEGVGTSFFVTFPKEKIVHKK